MGASHVVVEPHSPHKYRRQGLSRPIKKAEMEAAETEAWKFIASSWKDLVKSVWDWVGFVFLFVLILNSRSGSKL